MATSTTENTTRGQAGSGRVELRDIPLSSIVISEGFNPRGEVVHDAELEAMAETMRQRGCLQPVRVRASETGGYVLVAGERRYRAAVLASLVEIPASVMPAGAGNDAEQLDLLTDAMVENELRAGLNPLRRALGFQAMIDLGLSVRGVAERLGGNAKRGSREKRIREHLAILTLPEDVRKLVAEDKVPLLVVKALCALAKIHEELPALAVAAVLDVSDGEERFTWQEVANNAFYAAYSRCDRLPAGLFMAAEQHQLSTFDLSEKAKKGLSAYGALVGHPLVWMRFSPEHIERARVMGAIHQTACGTLIVGQDVVMSLVEDYIADALKRERARACDERKLDKERGAASTGDGGSEEQDAEAQRAAAQEAREEAIRFNLDLGVLVFKYLPKIKADERVLRILGSVDLARSLREIASRGARLCLPGWVAQTQQRNGKTKTTYLETDDAERRAAGFLEGARSAGDVAGRALTLIALASLANEHDAVPQSRRSHHRLTFRGPWAAQAERDLNAIIRERIKEGLLPELDVILSMRIAEDEHQTAHEQETVNAIARLEGAGERLSELEDTELEQMLSDAALAWGKYDPRTHELRAGIAAVRGQGAAASAIAGEHEHTDQQAALAALAA